MDVRASSDIEHGFISTISAMIRICSDSSVLALITTFVEEEVHKKSNAEHQNCEMSLIAQFSESNPSLIPYAQSHDVGIVYHEAMNEAEAERLTEQVYQIEAETDLNNLEDMKVITEIEQKDMNQHQEEVHKRNALHEEYRLVQLHVAIYR